MTAHKKTKHTKLRPDRNGREVQHATCSRSPVPTKLKKNSRARSAIRQVTGSPNAQTDRVSRRAHVQEMWTGRGILARCEPQRWVETYSCTCSQPTDMRTASMRTVPAFQRTLARSGAHNGLNGRRSAWGGCNPLPHSPKTLKFNTNSNFQFVWSMPTQPRELTALKGDFGCELSNTTYICWHISVCDYGMKGGGWHTLRETDSPLQGRARTRNITFAWTKVGVTRMRTLHAMYI